MNRRSAIALAVAGAAFFTSLGFLAARQGENRRGWTRGKGYGWVWGRADEVGALNTLGPADVLAATRLVTTGRVYDLGVPYDRNSYKWPGHSPGEIMTFRSPEGVKRQRDFAPAAARENRSGTAWHSCALFLSDNIGTQIDGLGHATEGEDNHWYNGFREREWGGDFGVRKCDADSIPPIVARGILIDVAGYRKVDALPAHTRIGPKDLQDALAAQGTRIRPGDVVLIRTGTLRHWGANGADHAKIAEHDSAGIDLDAAKWLVAQQGAVLVGSDTSGLEVGPAPEGGRSFMPVHNYLLIEQGVHIGEFHNLEALARDRIYEFAYVCATNRLRGTTAGFALRPIAIR